jgi:hypothetical protein
MLSFREFPSGVPSLPDASPMRFTIARWESGRSCDGQCLSASEGHSCVYCPAHPAMRRLLDRSQVPIPFEVEHYHLLTRRGLRVCDSARPTTRVEQTA